MSALDVDAGPEDPALVVSYDDGTFATVDGWANYAEQVIADPDGPTGTPA